MKRVIFLLGLLLSTPAWAQITVPDTIEPHMPIVAGCNCILPENGKAELLWQASEKVKYLSVGEGATSRIHIWAPPGKHHLDVIAIVTVDREIVSIVWDPEHPGDLSKAKTEVIKISNFVGVQRFAKDFTVTGTPGPGPDPGPDPDPDPGPGPTPTDAFGKEALKWLKAVPATAYTKAKAQGVADNYDAVAAQAVATSALPNLAAFTAAMKEKNLSLLGVDGVDAWRTPFFVPLANYQAKLAQDRGVTATNVPGLAKIYQETAAAIRAAAF